MSILVKVYNGPLRVAELLAVSISAALVMLMSLYVIVARNLNITAIDISAANVATYALTFHLCMFGAVIASRRARHVSMDVAQHVIRNQKAKNIVGAVTTAASAVAATILAYICWTYVFGVIEPGDTLLTGSSAWYWSNRLWKAPLFVSLVLISIHLWVASAAMLRGKLEHTEPV